jgi:hypothetical protein
VLRVIDSLQLTAKHKVSTPVNWKTGEDVVIAGSVSDDQAREIWPDGWDSPEAVHPDREAADRLSLTAHSNAGAGLPSGALRVSGGASASVCGGAGLVPLRIERG